MKILLSCWECQLVQMFWKETWQNWGCQGCKNSTTSRPSLGHVLQRGFRSIKNHVQRCSLKLCCEKWGVEVIRGAVTLGVSGCIPCSAAQQGDLWVRCTCSSVCWVLEQRKQRKILRPIQLCKFKIHKGGSMCFIRIHTYPRAHFKHMTLGVSVWEDGGCIPRISDWKWSCSVVLDSLRPHGQ